MATIHNEALNGTLNKTRIRNYRTTHGAAFDIDEVDVRGRTALSNAALKGHIEVVKALVLEGAEVNKCSKGHRSPLWYATSGTMPHRNRMEIVSFLLEKGAEIDEQSDDGNTPLMNVIVEFKDPKVISLLRDKGASLQIRNKDNKTAQELGDRTKDPHVIEALRHKSERGALLGDFVQLIISFILVIVAWMNSDVVNNVVKDVAKNLYNITGEKRPEITDEMKIQNPQTVQDFQLNIKQYIADTKMNDFFQDDTFLQKVAEKAAKLKTDPSTTLKSLDDVKDLTRLALFQSVIYCDDSPSMDYHGRLDAQKQLVKRIARITTKLVPDGEGVELQFINYEREFTGIMDAGEVEDLVAGVETSGATEIGTNLVKKILQRLVYDVIDQPGGRLKRPLVISVITDGMPGGSQDSPETPNTFREAIIECGKRLKKVGYHPTAVRFHISQIGSSSQAKNFLDGLRNDMKIQEVLYVTAGQLDKEYEKFRDNEEDLERWMLKLLMSPITDRDLS